MINGFKYNIISYIKMKYEIGQEYIKTNVPDFTKRLKNVLNIYQLDIYTTRINNRIYCNFMWEIIKHLEYGLSNPVPIEGGDYLEWAIGNLTTELVELKCEEDKIQEKKLKKKNKDLEKLEKSKK